jgi:hypothetical protein
MIIGKKNCFKLKLFETQLLFNLEINIIEVPWRRETFIVLQNELPNAINHHMIRMNSTTLKLVLISNISKINPTHNDIQYIIMQAM